MLAPVMGAALVAGMVSLVPTAPQAQAAGPVSSIDLLTPHALDERVAGDGDLTPIALDIDGRIVGAKKSTQAKAVDLSVTSKGKRYFVDCQAAGGGTGILETSPLNTLVAASALTLAAGDEVLLKRGTTCVGALTYTGFSGEAGKRIVINAYGDVAANAPVINGAGVPETVRIDNGEHWEIRNLEITNKTDSASDYTTRRRGIVVALTDFGRGTDYVVTDNYVHHVWGQNKKDLGGSGGIQFEAYAGTATIPTAFDGVEIAYNDVRNVNRSGINVGSDFRKRNSVGGSIGGNDFYPWGPLHIHDNLVSNVGGDAIVNQFAQGSVIENNTVWNSANMHGGKSNNGNNAAVWSWDSDYVTFRANHIFDTRMVAGTWDGTAFDADYGTAGNLFEYNVTHDNQGGFMLFCGCGGLSTDTVMRYNVSLNDGGGADSHTEGPRVFFNAGQSDGEVYNNTFLLYPNVQLSKGGANGSTAVLFANNVFLAQGDVRSTIEKAEVWRSNVFGGTWETFPSNGTNQLVPGLKMLDGVGLERLKVNTTSVIGAGRPIYPAVDEGLADSQIPMGVDISKKSVPSHIAPDAGAWQLTNFDESADVAIADGGFENASPAAWTLADATVATTGARNGSKSATLASGSATQEITAGLNKTYRLTAAIKGDVAVTLTLPRRTGDTQQPIVA
ncbi:MAG: right-handed parallel beta-helix repeat-containing protein, partial [Arachnia sp.]